MTYIYTHTHWLYDLLYIQTLFLMCYVAQIIICQTYQNTGPRIIYYYCVF